VIWELIDDVKERPCAVNIQFSSTVFMEDGVIDILCQCDSAKVAPRKEVELEDDL